MPPQPQPTSSSRMPGLQPELATDQLVLGLLGGVQPGGVGRAVGTRTAGLPHRARVGHGRPEQQLVELVADVVVVGDGGGVARDRVQPPLAAASPRGVAAGAAAPRARAMRRMSSTSRQPMRAPSTRRRTSSAAKMSPSKSMSPATYARARPSSPGRGHDATQRIGRSDDQRGVGVGRTQRVPS